MLVFVFVFVLFVGLGVGVMKIRAVRLMVVGVGVGICFSLVGGSRAVVELIFELFKVSFDESVQFVSGETVVTFTSVTVVFAPPYTTTRHDESIARASATILIYLTSYIIECWMPYEELPLPHSPRRIIDIAYAFIEACIRGSRSPRFRRRQRSLPAQDSEPKKEREE